MLNTHVSDLFYPFYYNFWFNASYIPGIMNPNTDTLSQNNVAVFFSQVSLAAENGIKIPRSLIYLVSLNHMWIFTAWLISKLHTILQPKRHQSIKHTRPQNKGMHHSVKNLYLISYM